ncbi:MAG: hypothetical protein GF383_07420 [Candidatus Lokiarchaeota archaeon]|nr:hypothetical protein [Candidatus Lokiarchaeota archaeon]MBD3340019.1 hypothetical protein [Candidatus Lokiarchaeota archaeon]
MTYKSIEIPEKIFDGLSELKHSNETISDLITRLIKSSKESNNRLLQSTKDKIKKNLNRALKKFKDDTIYLPDNWDGQGAKNFGESLWQDLVDFLFLIYVNLHAEGLNVPFPLVLPNTDGSLDIDWETDLFELLINFPPDPEALIHMYGEKIGSPKHELDVRINREIACVVVSEWLKKIL